MTLEECLKKLGPKAQKGSKPRCHFLTHGPRETVSMRLTKLISPFGVVGPQDTWMPIGFEDTAEAELHKAVSILSKENCEQLGRWWLKAGSLKSKTPNWDIVSTCTIGGIKGLMLIEAKAHVDELQNEESGKRLKDGCSENSKMNHDNIGQCITDASKGLSKICGMDWRLSHETHYQMSNRFAWAWKLTQLGFPVILLYLGFLEADEMKSPFKDENAWTDEVLRHSETLFPNSVWNHPLHLSNARLIPLIRSYRQGL